MIRHNHRYGFKLALLTLLVLISACGTAKTPEVAASSSESNGADKEIVAEAPGKTPTKTTETSSNDKALVNALSEEETGIADLREFVDEIAPLPEEGPEQGAEIAEATLSRVSESASSESALKQPTSNDKTMDTPATGSQDSPGFMVALTTNGLQTVDVQTGSTVDMPFEVDRDIVVSTLSKSFGDPTETVDTSECPAGPLQNTSWANGFSLNSLNETFVGWNMRPNESNENLTTTAGVGIGTSTNHLQAAYDVEIFESTLGTEFNVGQMSGLLSSDQPDGEITNLWAGTNCIFR